MSIGLSKSNIENKLKTVLMEELTPVIGLLAQEKIASTIAEIIVSNNRKIESDIQEQFNTLVNQLNR